MGQSRHILVVDDNGDVRDVIVAALQTHNYRVSNAPSGSVMRDFLETGVTVDCVYPRCPHAGRGKRFIGASSEGAWYFGCDDFRKSPDAMKYAMDNGLQLLRKPFRSQELYSAVNTALASGEFGQRPQGDG